MTQRSILAIQTAHGEHIRDLETRNPLGEPVDRSFDPFLILGHHGPQVFGPNNDGMPFSDHPHRGFETVTFILEGALVHTDSGGHRRTVKRGGVQWMTAGAGVGVAGYDARETDDEDPDRLAITQKMTSAYLKSALYDDHSIWKEACDALTTFASGHGYVERKHG